MLSISEQKEYINALSRDFSNNWVRAEEVKDGIRVYDENGEYITCRRNKGAEKTCRK